MLLVLLLPWDLFVVGPTKISHEEDTFFNQFLNPFLDKSDGRYNITKGGVVSLIQTKGG
jgi:hypothetical protein